MIHALREAARTLEFFSDSYLATLAIAVVVAYLGTFVVLKRIVFLGITLAQAASAGIALAFFAEGFLGHDTVFAELVEEHGPTAGALGVSSLGVAAFALPAESKRISREALLGLGYVLFGAAAILLVWRSPRGIDELKNLLAGDVLFARGHLASLLAGLAVVAALHAALRKEFLLVSFDPEFARTLRLPVRLYEVLLALSVGIAVSLALKVAGILLVFAFLTVAPIGGLALGRKLGHATGLAVALAATSACAGFLAAERADLPVAPTVATVLVALAGLAWVASRLPRLVRRSFTTVVSVLAVAAAGFAVDAVATHGGVGRASAPREDIAPLDSAVTLTGDALLERFRTASSVDVRLDAARRLVETATDAVLARFVRTALGDDDEKVRETAVDALMRFSRRERAVRAVETLLGADDANLRLHAALGLLRLGDARGVMALVSLLRDPHALAGTRQEALDALLGLAPEGKAFGYDAFAKDAANHKAVLRWEAWAKASSGRLPEGPR